MEMPTIPSGPPPAAIKSSLLEENEKWAPNASRGSCTKCHEKFSLLNRKHHCRMCGLIFCYKCSRFRIKLGSKTTKSRVCENCFPKAICTNSPPMNSFINSRAWVPRGLFTHMLRYLNHVDLCIVSMSCRWWYKRACLDIVWRPLYYDKFGQSESDETDFHRFVHGIDFSSLSWMRRFAVRWSVNRAAEKKKKFEQVSALLETLRLSKYAHIFEREEIDVESLCLMNAGHLRELGIPTGPRLKLLNAAAYLASFPGEEDDLEEESELDPEAESAASRLHKHKAEMKQYRASLVRRVQQSIVRIAVLTMEGTLCNVGSGTIIHPKGLIATARHCLANEEFDAVNNPNFMILVAPTESMSSPPLWKYRACSMPSCADEELDFALLKLVSEVVSDPPSGLYIGDVTERHIARNWEITEVQGSSPASIGKLLALPIGNSNNMDPGDQMWMFGYPSSGHNTITVHHAICSGTDSQLYDGRNVGKAWLRTAAQLDNGFSGGAAVNSKGQLVGLISFSVLRQDRVRAINMVKGFIETAKVELCPPTIQESDKENSD